MLNCFQGNWCCIEVDLHLLFGFSRHTTWKATQDTGSFRHSLVSRHQLLWSLLIAISVHMLDSSSALWQGSCPFVFIVGVWEVWVCLQRFHSDIRKRCTGCVSGLIKLPCILQLIVCIQQQKVHCIQIIYFPGWISKDTRCILQLVGCNGLCMIVESSLYSGHFLSTVDQ